jgi:hypothetical protein
LKRKIENRKVQTFSSMPNTISYNLDRISELVEGAYVSAFKDCSLRAWTSKYKLNRNQDIISIWKTYFNKLCLTTIWHFIVQLHNRKLSLIFKNSCSELIIHQFQINNKIVDFKFDTIIQLHNRKLKFKFYYFLLFLIDYRIILLEDAPFKGDIKDSQAPLFKHRRICQLCQFSSHVQFN